MVEFKNKIFTILLTSIMVTFSTAVTASENIRCDENTILESLQGPVTLREATDIIFSQTGCSIQLSSIHEQVEIKGSYVNSSLNRFFKRALRGINYSVIYDENSTVIRVEHFGHTGDNIVTNNPAEVMDENQLNIFAGKLPDQVKDIQKEQKARAQLMVEAPNAREPVTGVLYSEIAATHKKQNKTLQAVIDSPIVVDPVTGKKHSKASLIKQAHFMHEELKMSGAKEPVSGTLYSEIERIHARQLSSAIINQAY